MEDDLGRAFVDALSRKDFDEISGLLDPEVDFRGLTPGRAWEASGSRAVTEEVLSLWLEESDHIDGVVSVERDAVADRQRIAYRLEGTNPDGPFVFEQQAYFTERDGRIDWMRVLCSGFRPR
jgi:SnoaL-like domain